MTLRGIDVSSYQGWPLNTVASKGFDESHFVIVKATEGTNYVSRTCDPVIQKAIKAGKLWGFYHYARGGSATAEAQYFVKNTKNYFGLGIPCLDWEAGGNKAWGSMTWAENFVNEVFRLTGVWCMVYVQASAIGQLAYLSSKCALWEAGYPSASNASWNAPRFPYGTGKWKNVTIWQYTSAGGLDRNIGYLSASAWHKIAKADKGAVKAFKTIANKVTAPKAKNNGKLKVDGLAGYATIYKWQQVMHTPADGKVSGQVMPVGYSRPNLVSVTYGGQGSALIKAVQKVLKARGVYTGNIDGLLGPKAIDGLHRYLGVAIAKNKPWTVFGPAVVKAIQKRLNQNKF